MSPIIPINNFNKLVEMHCRQIIEAGAVNKSFQLAGAASCQLLHMPSMSPTMAVEFLMVY